jgi:hypothetical protein
MWNLGEYRKHPQRLADHLPWATLIAPGVMLNKDGSLQKTIAFRGPDLDSSTPYELVAARARMSSSEQHSSGGASRRTARSSAWASSCRFRRASRKAWRMTLGTDQW